jgi:hypothetical protein
MRASEIWVLPYFGTEVSGLEECVASIFTV